MPAPAVDATAPSGRACERRRGRVADISTLLAHEAATMRGIREAIAVLAGLDHVVPTGARRNLRQVHTGREAEAKE
jgi:hypothetical protein